MCGIFGYLGEKNPLDVCLKGLKQLEYRGYDSTGLAGVFNGELHLWKEAGKVARLEEKIGSSRPPLSLAIGHTRWATHGPPSERNAHPHTALDSFALVHNGIIENFDQVKQEHLQGISLQSDTDSEVIVQLIAKAYKGDLLQAVADVLPLLEGLFAIAVIHKEHPDQIIAAAREAPLSVGYNEKEALLSSDPNAYMSGKFWVHFLRQNELARIKKGEVELFNASLEKVNRKPEKLEFEEKPPSKEGYAHYMLKEITEQPLTVQKAYLGRFEKERVLLEKLPFDLSRFQEIKILGCGTSAHAGHIGALYFEELAKIRASCEISSEARFRFDLLGKETLVIAISQSGETADTLAALREAKKRGCTTLGICNVKNSTIPREADGCLFLKAGPEISVCSTKAFSSQLTVLYLLALQLAGEKKALSSRELTPFLEGLEKIPSQIETILSKQKQLDQLAEKYARYNDFFFMGRRYMFYAALEAALKLKEISYVNANGYPAGELKHGPIALLGPRFPVIAFLANLQTHEKSLSSLMEVKARGAPLLVITQEGDEAAADIADDTFFLPSTSDLLAPLTSSVAGQLLAYLIAKKRGCDIDQPRNLAKSVTVE
jgi:glucosamine--fructose-6-phosphate aminotransferase (isomerizing)